MCGCTPSQPDGSLPGGTPTGPAGGTGVCCACPANGDVSTNGVGEYFSTTYGSTAPLVNKCKVAIIRTETGGSVTISKSFSFTYTMTATEAAHKPVTESAIRSAMSAWQSAASNFRVSVLQPGCSEQKLTMLYTATFPASGGDVVVDVDNRPAETPGLRSVVDGGTAMHFFINGAGDTTWTMTHETGHTFGLEDEYAYSHPSTTAPTFTYKGADAPDKTVTLSPSTIPPETAGAHSFENATIMGVAGNNTYLDFHFYWIAIEVKKILQAAGVSATVKIVAP
jgi:Fe-S cluster assembly iron-binding protein IscA